MFTASLFMHIASYHHINIMHHHNKDTSSYISSNHHCMCTSCIFNIQCASLSYLSSACLDYTPELHQHCWSINISLHTLLGACLGSVHARKKLETVNTSSSDCKKIIYFCCCWSSTFINSLGLFVMRRDPNCVSKT